MDQRPARAALLCCWLLQAAVPGSVFAQDDGTVPEPSNMDKLEAAGRSMDNIRTAMSPGEAARALYHSGMRDLDRAQDLSAKSERVEKPKRIEKLQTNSFKAYQTAAGRLMYALRLEPDLIEAYEALGFALRELGEYNAALGVHREALERDPESVENFRGWSETLLELSMVSEAIEMHEHLVDIQSPWAAVLVEEMEKWLAVRQVDPGGLKVEEVERLAEWVAEREGG